MLWIEDGLPTYPDVQLWLVGRRLDSVVSGRDGRGEVLGRLVTLVEQRSKHGTLRVAIDGVDAAGKTTLADEWAGLLEVAGVPVLRASIDGFHRPASARHLRGEELPARSYYEDSFDYPALRSLLLDPLGPAGNHEVRTRVFNFGMDRPVTEAPIRVRPGTTLLFDGVFLLRPELEGCWDLSVFVEIEPATSLQRAVKRDIALFGTSDATEQRYRQRYLPGQELYLSLVQPHLRADILIDNNDPENPILLRIPTD